MDKNNNTNSFIPGDCVYEIFQYLDKWFMVRVCSLVSCLWREKVLKIPFSLTRNDHQLLRMTGLELAKALSTSELSFEYLNLDEQFITDEGLKLIVHSRSMQNLHTLVLNSNSISVEGIKEMATSEFMRNLTSLDLSKNNIRTAGVEALVNSNVIKSLRILNLMNTMIDSTSVEHISRNESMRNLTELNLHYNDIDFNGITHLSKSAILENLTSISVGQNPITQDGLIMITESHNMRNITTLEAMATECEMMGIKKISQNLKYLKRLDLRVSYSANQEDFLFIFESENMSNLEYLAVSYSSWDGISSLCKSPYMIHLKELDLSDCFLNNSISNINNLINLTSLKLPNNFLLQSSIDAIAELPNLTNLNLKSSIPSRTNLDSLVNNLKKLVNLNLSNNQLLCYEINKIASSVHMKNLTRLKLENTGISDHTISNFCYSPHMQNITYLNLNTNNLKYESGIILANNRYLFNLETLHLDGSMSFKGISEITRSKKVSNIRHLYFERESSGKLLESIFSSPYLKNIISLRMHYVVVNSILTSQMNHLRHLTICNGSMNASLMKDFVNCDFKVLSYLDLSNNSIEDEGVLYLANSSLMTTIAQLYLNTCKITTEGVKYIVSSNHKITDLSLTSNKLKDATRYLSSLKSLQTLNLYHCELSQNDVQLIKQNLCTVQVYCNN